VPGILVSLLYILVFAVASTVVFTRPSGLRMERLAEKLLEEKGISGREREVLELLFEGKTNQEIADGLFISLSTVKTHLSSIFNKTGTRNRMEVARVFGRTPPPKV